MKELIKVSINKGNEVVSARELYTFLDIKTDFTNWCKRMFEYGLVEGIDFTPIMAKSTGGRPSNDYALTLDCAKQISMIQRSEKGKQARLYFIDCERRLFSNVTNQLFQHTLRDVQVHNSKLANNTKFKLSGKEATIKYHQDHCVLVTKYSPSELKIIAKRRGLKSKQRSSGKEVVRALYPAQAAQMSLNDSLVNSGMELSEANSLSAPCAPLFSKLLQLNRISV